MCAVVSPVGNSKDCESEHLWYKLISANIFNVSPLSSGRLHIPREMELPLTSDPSQVLFSLPEKPLPSHHLRYYFFQEALLEFPLPASQ